MKFIRRIGSAIALLPLVLGFASSTGHAADKLKVVATIPDLADLVNEIGGDRVEVSTIAKGRENLHAVSARPSHLNALSRADVFVQVGLSLEASFVPGLMEIARNAKIQPGKPGFCSVSDGFEAIEKPASLSRKAGDVHPQGNPHMNLDPRAGKHMAQKILEALVRADESSHGTYQQRFDSWARKYDDALARWTDSASSWKGEKVVVYHVEYDYFAACWGIDITGSIELKPGIPPTPNHIAALVTQMREQKCKVILTAPWSNNDTVERIANATGAKIVELPNQAGGSPGAETWLSMMDLVHQRVAKAFEAQGR